MKWWRCVWPYGAGGELASVEVVDPPEGASEACFTVPQGKGEVAGGHGCFVEAESIDGAIARVRAMHGASH